MLVDFSVTNYRSFGGRATLSMVAARPFEDEHGRVFVADSRPAQPLRLLRSAAVLGANGSGKSNLVMAVSVMQHLVEVSGGRRGTLGHAHAPFRLDSATRDAPSEFEVSAIVDGERYTYGFAAKADAITEEWLYAGLPRTRRLFVRHGQSIEYGDSWRGDREALRQRTRPDALHLSVCADYNHPVASLLATWFTRDLRVVTCGPNDLDQDALRMALESTEFRDELLRYLDAADLGVQGIEVESRAMEPAFALSPGRHRFSLKECAEGEHEAEELLATTLRRDADGSLVRFSLGGDESDGTARMVTLAAAWVSALANDCVLVVDEYDARLHPRLSRFLLETWHRAPSRAQLIITTHNTDLLEGDLLRSDQVWLTEKKQQLSTDLYSLAEFKSAAGRRAHPSDNFRRAYLAGRYGAVPVPFELDHARQG